MIQGHATAHRTIGEAAASTTTANAMAGTEGRKFGVLLGPVGPVPELIEQARWVESLGFDQVYLPDHSANLFNRGEPWFDGLSLLTAVATQTETIRLGAMVANPILRPPSELAKWARTIDHVSGGRLELGIGAGVFPWDHHAVGEEPWPAKVRAERFVDYVAIVDGILRGDSEPFSYQGQRLWVKDVGTAPGPVQRPRPPIVVGGQAPTILRTAARFADVWNTIGPMGADAETILEVTARQNRLLDELCEAAGRDPESLRRSYLTYGPFDIWDGSMTLDEVVERFGEIGITDFGIGWLPGNPREELERLARETIPALRNG